MNTEHFTPEEQQLIDQLQALPKPELDAAARDTIRQRMMSELRGLTLNGQQPLPAPAPAVSVSMLVVIGVVIAAIVTVIVVAALMSQPDSEILPATPTVVVSPTELLPTPATQTAVLTVTPNATLTSTPTTTPLHTATSVPLAASSTPVSATPQPTMPPTQTIVIEGPITSIVASTLTIYDFTIVLAPAHPILNIVNVGDVVRVEGSLGNDGTVSAEVISNFADDGTPSTVSIEGPVEAINGNLITVNGIQVQLDSNDPLLPTLQVGQFVSVRGNFQQGGTTIVLVVVNIVVVNNVVIDGDPACWYHDNGMGMGHWHCDGMGMGMGEAMGMGEGMGMGMGN